MYIYIYTILIPGAVYMYCRLQTIYITVLQSVVPGSSSIVVVVLMYANVAIYLAQHHALFVPVCMHSDRIIIVLWDIDRHVMYVCRFSQMDQYSYCVQDCTLVYVTVGLILLPRSTATIIYSTVLRTTMDGVCCMNMNFTQCLGSSVVFVFIYQCAVRIDYCKM